MFVERAAGMRTHPGQIAFPGGAADAGDHDIADTALREAAEETGVDRAGIEVLGMLPPEVNGHLIWGLTAHLLDGVLDLAGWQRPWDPRRIVSIPARYLTDSRPDSGGPDAH